MQRHASCYHPPPPSTPPPPCCLCLARVRAHVHPRTHAWRRARQATTLARKRAEYTEMLPQYYDIPASERSEEEQAALRQVGECGDGVVRVVQSVS